MTTIPACASRCTLVESLIAQLAQARGMTVRMVRTATGLIPDPPPPQPVYVCEACGTTYTSKLAAAECADFDYQR